ncbi:MAG: helix-turn-helix domain-containing protein [Oscillospiraceae bacterium]
MNTVQLIQEELSKKSISPSKMMKDLGFSSGLFSQWKNGLQKPSMEKLQKIADYLGVSLDYILGRTNQPNAIVKTTGYVMKENTIENNSNNGDNIINNSSVSSETDEMTSELIKRFNNLSFDEKIEVFNYIKNIKE